MPDLPRLDVVLYGALALLALVLGMRVFGADGQGSGGAGPGGGAAAVATIEPAGPTGAPADALLRVHVAGAVRRPGVYSLPEGSRVLDALREAGGPTRRGDPNALNLAAKVDDGRQVLVPVRPGRDAGAGGGAVATGGAAPTGGAPPTGGDTGGGSGVGGAGPSGRDVAGGPAPLVNLNTATLAELDTLAGVGPVTAQKILEFREQHGGFASVEDLANVPGIGPKRLEALRPKVTT